MNETEALREAVRAMVQTGIPSGLEPHGGFDAALWATLDEHGMTRVGIPEEYGGEGGGLHEAAAIVDEASYAAAFVPLADTLLVSNWLLSRAGVKVPGASRVAVALGGTLSATSRDGDTVVSGRLDRVSWAGACDRLAIVLAHEGGEGLAVVSRDALEIIPGRNIAGEPTAAVVLDNVAIGADAIAGLPVSASASEVMVRGALARAVQMTGAMRSALAISIAHTSAREQFGRPLSKFQAIQQLLAQAASEVAAATAATDGAVRTAGAGGDAEFEVAAAKIRVGLAAGAVARITHHVHGAIGLTKEYRLQLLTRRLWAWRDEYGSEAFWERRLADHVAGMDAAALWDRIVA
jgi:acyl-CoA dehydrogenase